MLGKQRTPLLASTLVVGLAGGSMATAGTAASASAAVISAAQEPIAMDHAAPCKKRVEKKPKRCLRQKGPGKRRAEQRRRASLFKWTEKPPEVLSPTIKWPNRPPEVVAPSTGIKGPDQPSDVIAPNPGIKWPKRPDLVPPEREPD
ncbi:hypothetical protein [Nonomuraea sp. NPDC049400]|uniref:hypothetical protein n=1 Tax=Nonomuraea sp. NPDC049400 TaxID=3364352 RepID=UPI0037889929